MKSKSSALLDIIRGMVIGIANIIPGVSGGTMMVSMGIYDKLIHIVNHLATELKKHWKFLLEIVIGILLAILLLSNVLSICLERWPIATNLAFCGLIAGSLPTITAQVRHKGFNASMAICFILFFLIVIGGALYSGTGTANAVLSTSFVSLLMVFLVGIITAATMVIPGVSGSMILMILGYYEPVLNKVSSLLHSLIAREWSVFGSDFVILMFFGFGVLVGIFAIAKLIEWVLARWRVQTYWAIIGLVLASPIAILIKTDWSHFSIIQLVLGVVLFTGGWYAAERLTKMES